MKKAYFKLASWIMTSVFLIVLVMTLIYQFTSVDVFSSVLNDILVAVFLVITLICLFISVPGGKTSYKIGFYILHGGIVVLLVGFAIYGFLGRKYNVTVFRDGNYYNAIKDGENSADLGFYFRLDGTETEYYTTVGDEEPSVKQYHAYITVKYRDIDPIKRDISINHPIRENGYKIYLMDISGGDDVVAALLFKYDPAEVTINAGITLLIVGTFVMCYFGNISFGKKENVTLADGKEITNV